MTQYSGNAEWINAYLEWTESEPGEVVAEPFADRGVEASVNSAMDIAAVYLEWMDEAAGAAQRTAIDFGTPDLLREAALLMALRTESECVHILRQALDNGDPTSHTLRLAVEALEYAKSLLENERRAWHALSAIRDGDGPGRRIAWTAEPATAWPYALETLEADVRALSGRIVELQAH